MALWQTQYVADLLGVPVDPVIVETSGDRRLDVPIEAIRGQGVFVKEVQAAVLDGRADFAVHSAKDLPSETAPGLQIAAIPERGDARDALVGCALDDLPPGAIVATGSVRRRAQLAALRPDLTFANLRGNIDTRLRKAPRFDAIVMAYAALQRMDRVDSSVHVVPSTVIIPQVGQGALAAECRSDDDETASVLRRIQHGPTRRAVDAERAFLAGVGSGCDVPAAAYATVDDSDVINLRTLLSSLDGRVVLRAHGADNDGIALGQRLAHQLMHDDAGHQFLMDFHLDPR